MSSKKMLIDAAHPEETRVVVLDGNKLEDFDVEVSSRRQLKGNIYLAKVIRVEPSLQAAFVDYGGNRHGFLAFSEIHPDYYQIPIEDREEAAVDAAPEAAVVEDVDASNGDDEAAPEGTNDENGATKDVEILGGEDDEVINEGRSQRPNTRNYKIQEVIKRRQIILIQVVKEERGNKGAALTTYISLAGRYCVLMPNTARGGGGISRKVTNTADRKHLKSILNDLEIPGGMGVIVRTAGTARTKAEIKRDYEYLLRLWTTVRELTLESSAPTLVHEEGDLIRRSIRDLYTRDIEEIQVEGDDAYRAAKDFMKLLIPSHARKVKQYKDADISLFRTHGVEDQMDAMHNPIVQMKSGGYIVINQTEALVAIDVNSGRSTKERNIEETAVKTNLEAADEVARQVRLRDLAGLVVIDFIDMDVNRNNAAVERRVKEAMKNDRARIQIGRISAFGLLEMSRQRLRPSLAETSSEPCPHCDGTGVRRSTETTALSVLRAIEEEGGHRRASEITVHVPTEVALYILNNKRDAVKSIEERYEMNVLFASDDSLIPPDLRIERTKNLGGETISEMVATTRSESVAEDSSKRRRRSRRRKKGEGAPVEAPAQVVAEPTEAAAEAPAESTFEEDEDGDDKPKRRRRGRRGGRRRRGRGPEDAEEGIVGENGETPAPAEGEPAIAAESSSEVSSEASAESSQGDTEGKTKRRRRRRRKPAGDAQASEAQAGGQAPANGEAVEAAPAEAGSTEGDAEAAPTEEKPKRRRRTRKKPESTDAPAETVAAPAPAEATPAPAPVAADPAPVAAPAPAPVEAPTAVVAEAASEEPARKGWWKRITGE